MRQSKHIAFDLDHLLIGDEALQQYPDPPLIGRAARIETLDCMNKIDELINSPDMIHRGALRSPDKQLLVTVTQANMVTAYQQRASPPVHGLMAI